MREVGIEPTQALSYCDLNATRLTTPALPLACYNYPLTTARGFNLATS